MKLRPIRPEELMYLQDKLSPEERDELLRCLLTAAPSGAATMIRVLELLLLCYSVEELLEEHAG